MHPCFVIKPLWGRQRGLMRLSKSLFDNAIKALSFCQMGLMGNWINIRPKCIFMHWMRWLNLFPDHQISLLHWGKRIRDASIYTSKKISLKLLFLSDIFLFPFVRQQFPVLAYRCSWRQCCCFVDNIGYIFKEVNTLQSAGACKRIEHSCPFGTSMRPEEKRVSSG